jgi:hypothetical protein
VTLNRHHGADSQFPERETLDSLIPANVLSHEVCVHRVCRGTGHTSVHGSDLGAGGRAKNVEKDLFWVAQLSEPNLKRVSQV